MDYEHDGEQGVAAFGGDAVTIDDVISDVIRREADYVNDPLDKGGPTRFGITAKTLGNYRNLGRFATADEVRNMPESVARAIYFDLYVQQPGFDTLPEWVLPIVVDDGVLSGQKTAAQTLQRVVGVAADGVIGPVTRRAVEKADPRRTLKRIVVERILRYVHIVLATPSQARFIEGWIVRAVSFL